MRVGSKTESRDDRVNVRDYGGCSHGDEGRRAGFGGGGGREARDRRGGHIGCVPAGLTHEGRDMADETEALDELRRGHGGPSRQRERCSGIGGVGKVCEGRLTKGASDEGVEHGVYGADGLLWRAGRDHGRYILWPCEKPL
jgi:hypothetical protein